MISGCTLQHNIAVCGGAVYVAGGSLSIAASSLERNAADEGGAIFQFAGRANFGAAVRCPPIVPSTGVRSSRAAAP